MKRRLTRAYDRMTMPDSCAHRIEQRLNQQLQAKKEGKFVKAVPPAPVRRKSWAAAAAAVCIVLLFSVGVTLLSLHGADRMRTVSRETQATEAEKFAVTPADHYAIATSIPVSQVENTAKRIRDQVLNEDWEALADRISYSIIIQDQEIREKKKFIEWMEIFSMNPSFMEAIRNETCTAMFCNWQGICMGDGQIWLNEEDGELKITAVNVGIREEMFRQGQKQQVPLEFASVLSGNPMKFTGSREEMLLEDYCTALWGESTVTGFAVVDMDADLICEVVVSAQSAAGTEKGHLVLRLEGKEICAYPFWHGDFFDLKKDGSFSRSSHGPSQGSFWLEFEGKGSCSVTRDPVESDSSLCDWHTYPCRRADLVLQSYEYVTGTGQSRLPSNPYYHFEGLTLGSMGNDWALQKEQLLRYGTACVEDEGTVCVFDPDAPGTALYGTLTNENGVVQFSELGFYMSTAETQQSAEVRNLLSDEPEYWVDAHLPALGSMGRQVFSPEELISYFGFTQYSDEVILERNAAREVLENFTAAWMAGDEKAMKRYLAEDFQEDTRRNGSDDHPTGPVELITILNLPYWGEECYVTAEFRETEENRYFSICLDLVKQKGDWKVRSCYYGSP